MNECLHNNVYIVEASIFNGIYNVIDMGMQFNDFENTTWLTIIIVRIPLACMF